MQEISLLQAHMIAFAAGFVMDIVIGDPHNIPHPVKWIGNLIALLDRKLLGEIRNQLSTIDGAKANAELKSTGELTLNLSVGEVKLSEEDLLIDVKQMEGLYTVNDNNVTVVLDTTLTPELIEEGFVREIISKIQTMRKDAGFEVMDHILIGVSGNEKISKLINDNKDSIFGDVLADGVSDSLDGFEKDWNINGEKVVLSVKKV